MERKNYIIIFLIFLVSLFSFITFKKSFNNTIISSKKVSFERETYRDKTDKYDLLKVPVETHGGMVTDTQTKKTFLFKKYLYLKI